MTIPVEAVTLYDPRTGVERQHYKPDDVDGKVTEAREAFAGWSSLTPGRRQAAMLAFADLLAAESGDLTSWEMLGTGKPQADAFAEVLAAVDLIRFYAGAARLHDGIAAGSYMPGTHSWVRQEPLGVVAAIVPWNYPLLMAAWRLGPALAAGNTVVLKPAESTPDTAWALQDIADETLGPNVVAVAAGDRATGQMLASHPGVEMVAFTGSIPGGEDVQRRAAGKRLSLELGGNCPAVVMPDAPADTAEKLAFAAVYNAGQSCAAPSRIIVVGDADDRRTFAGRLQGCLAGLHAGRDFGPLNSSSQLYRLQLLLGASRPETVWEGDVTLDSAAVDGEDGYWQPPMVLDGVVQDDPAVVAELFGPVLTVQNTPDLAGAVRLANGLGYALAASVWTQDMNVALQASAGLRGGEVWINTVLAQTAELPHGGVGKSGHGTDMSRFAVAEYQRVKTVTAALT